MITAKEMKDERKKTISAQMKSDLEDLFWKLNEYDFTELIIWAGVECPVYPTLSKLDSVHLSIASDYLKEKGYSPTLVYSNCEIYYIHVSLPNPSGLPHKVYSTDTKFQNSDDMQKEFNTIKVVESLSPWGRFKRWITGG